VSVVESALAPPHLQYFWVSAPYYLSPSKLGGLLQQKDTKSLIAMERPGVRANLFGHFPFVHVRESGGAGEGGGNARSRWKSQNRSTKK
jgi:hypothetical protein